MHILTDYKSDIKGMISYFDRIIIKGYNRQLCNSKQFGYLLNMLKKKLTFYVSILRR